MRAMKNTRLIQIFAALSLCPALGAAADLTGVFAAAKQRSESLGQAAAALEKADAVSDEALGNWLPQLKLQLAEAFANPGGNTSLQSPSLALNGKQTLLSGLDQPAALRAGKALKSQARALEAKAEQDLAREVGGDYFDVLNLEEQIAIERAAADVAVAVEKDLEQRVRLGRNRRAELSSAQAEVARVRASLAVLQGRLSESRLGLASLSGLPEDQSYDAPAPLSEASRALSETLSAVPSVTAAEAALAVMQAKQLAVKGGFLPSLYAQGNWYLAGQNAAATVPNWDASVGVDLPIFQGGAQLARLREANADLRSAQLDLDRAKRLAQQEQRQASAAMGLALARVDASQQALDAAEKSWTDQQRDFHDSIISSLDALNAFSAVESARLDASNARWDAQRAALRVRLADGALEP